MGLPRDGTGRDGTGRENSSRGIVTINRTAAFFYKKMVIFIENYSEFLQKYKKISHRLASLASTINPNLDTPSI